MDSTEDATETRIKGSCWTGMGWRQASAMEQLLVSVVVTAVQPAVVESFDSFIRSCIR